MENPYSRSPWSRRPHATRRPPAARTRPVLGPAVLAHVEAASGERLDTLDRTQLRQAATREIDRMFHRFGLAGPDVERVVDHEVLVDGGSILVRSYHPYGRARSAGHVYLHGGGWTSGSIRELVCDATARHRTASASCVTCLVEYRLAPEHRFPTAVHDVVSAVRWVVDRAIELQIDPQRITLGGASAGANLAVAAVLAAPDLALRGLLLEVPALDLRDGGALALPDDIDPADATWIRPMQEDYRAAVTAYLGRVDDGCSPLATPLLAPDVSMFPETFIQTAELDVLRPGAEQFAVRLEQAGVPTRITRYTGALHGSPILNATWSTARRWHDDSLAILRHLHELGPDETS